MRRTRVIVPAALAVLLALAAVAGTAAAARPGHEADHAKKHKHTKVMAGMTAAEMAAMNETASADDRGFAALANGEKFGIWGGMSERERRRIRRARALARRSSNGAATA